MSGNNLRRLRRPETDEAAPGRRWKTNWPAELVSPQGRTRCLVLDISSWGARLGLDPAPSGLPDRVSLVIDGVSTIAAQIVWESDNIIGLQFLEQQAWIRRLHAHRLDPATWSAANLPPRS
jgi:hypothetical protein